MFPLAQHRSGSEDERMRAAALTGLTIGRVVDACPWTDSEVDRLVEVYSGDPWFAAPVSC